MKAAAGAAAKADTETTEDYPRAPASWLEVQVELARRGFSGGPIDGLRGVQSVAALQAFQQREQIEVTGELDDATREHLQLKTPAIAIASLSAEDLASLHPLPTTWLGKSQATSLAYETALELAAERYHAGANFLRRLNPDFDWTAPEAGAEFKAPAITRTVKLAHPARLRVRLADHVLEAEDDAGAIIVHFPVSIARKVEKRPIGELHVKVVAPDPDYTFDPEVFPESEEAQQLGHRLMIPPGPNNPVGVAWIGLDLPGYGIHGTPEPEKVGHTESHGCFRLANWDARTLLELVWIGLPVIVEP